jgi:hypothetical protein
MIIIWFSLQHTTSLKVFIWWRLSHLYDNFLWVFLETNRKIYHFLTAQTSTYDMFWLIEINGTVYKVIISDKIKRGIILDGLVQAKSWFWGRGGGGSGVPNGIRMLSSLQTIILKVKTGKLSWFCHQSLVKYAFKL